MTGQCDVLHHHNVTVYVLPEPWLGSGGPRRGPYNDCRMTHNGDKLFNGLLEVVGDLSVGLFRGVAWSSEPAAQILHGNEVCKSGARAHAHVHIPPLTDARLERV